MTGTGSASPATACPGTLVTFTVNVTPGTFPASTGINVTGNFLTIGLGAAEPFTARLNPDADVYSTYDQLMRLDEWIGLEDTEA